MCDGAHAIFLVTKKPKHLSKLLNICGTIIPLWYLTFLAFQTLNKGKGRCNLGALSMGISLKKNQDEWTTRDAEEQQNYVWTTVSHLWVHGQTNTYPYLKRENEKKNRSDTLERAIILVSYILMLC